MSCFGLKQFSPSSTMKTILNFPGPLEHTIRTGTYQSPPGTVLEQIWPQEAEQSRFLSKYVSKKSIAFSARFARLLSYKVLLFERRWISVSTSHIHSRTALLHSEHSWSIEIDKVQKVVKSSSERNFLENGAHFQNLGRSQSLAT